MTIKISKPRKVERRKGVNEVEVGVTEMNGNLVNGSAAPSAPRQVPGLSRGEHPAADDGVSLSQENLKQMVEQMQSHLDSMNVSLQYSFYGEGGEKVAVQVVNRETGDVIREIPSREMQALQAKMSELVGMIFNDNA